MLQLWPQVLHNNGWEYIARYMNNRAGIANCQGQTPLAVDVGTHWYHLKNPNDIENFGVCVACYEDVVLATPFGEAFRSDPILQPADELWNCKLTAFARRLMEKSVGARDGRDWHYVAASVNATVKVPECDGPAGVVGAERNWWRPKQAVGDMVACEHCYYLYFAAFFMKNDWEPVHADVIAASRMNTWVCDMSLLR